ncbi:phosphomannomutase/phosphoglucomutase [Methylobacter sp. YRD-M1]|uniref:phosphomannomutase/phosphoglucomutase n=1 Tax=Methylobacter sp. YRD-M1 TaxID=2911520 RepID=UPI00227C10B3|nr:phosphomannomutase/phosphoglucomutase [Methylobacter sp. YRD-M1]WAK01971.1 phosphomannomutase/phosphoglucomutase [Methylobacter sp. YRD-M1]
MERIFAWLSAVVILMILSAGAGVYWISASEVAQAKQSAATAQAQGVALALSEQIAARQRILDKLAQDPEVLAAVSSTDPALLSAVASTLEKQVPDALKIRVLLPGASGLDEKSVPRMGYADLDMVRETFAKNQPAAIQGDQGPDRHLAMTSRIMRNDQAVGVMLASLNYDFINKSLQAMPAKGSYLELRQAALVLGSSGDQAAGELDANEKIDVAHADWQLHYRYSTDADVHELSMIAGLILIIALFAALAFFAGYRKLSERLDQDISIVLKAFKDMITHKSLGNYPVYLSQMQGVIPTLAQYKRVMEGHDDQAITINHDEIFNSVNSSLNLPVIEEDLLDEAVVVTTKTIGKDLPKPIEMPDAMAAIFRAYDIRGIVGKTLTEKAVYDIGRALGTEARQHGCRTIVVGRDGRTSSPILAEALADGILATGQNVLDIGMVPTPTLYFVTKHTEGQCGVMITGSHNPADYNGLKMVINGETLAGDRIQQLKQCIMNQAYATGEGRIERNTLLANDYIGAVAEDIHIARPMRVVLDCGNGVAGELGPVLLRSIGCEVFELFCDVDGTFPNHHPDPSKPDNLADLIASVKHYQADLGIAFDGDGDRLGVIDSNGKIIWPDRQMMLFAKDVLASKPGAEIIYDVKCSRHLTTEIVKRGGRPVMWKTGHSLMKAKLKETGAKLAGEMSGHIFFNDRWFGFDDALYSAARLIEILSADTRTSAEVFADFPDSFNTPELNIELTEGENFKFIESMFSTANFTGGKITTIDGMRVDFANGWGLVRASNTTPSLVVRFEADTRADLSDIQAQFRQLMQKIKPDIVLPF